jgi:hypothetical protein
MFYLGSGSDHFLIPDPVTYMKSGIQTYFFHASYAFRSKVKILVLVMVKKIGIRKKFSPDPDPGDKKHRIRNTGKNVKTYR